MIFVIAEVPPSENCFRGRKNVWDYRTEKQRWTSMVFWSCKVGGIKKIEGRAKVRITYFFKGNIRRDADNYSGKFILDGLVKAGVIKDDSFQVIDLELHGVMGCDKPRTEIEVEEI
jgi:Holliday junction resolvase RusA-like endonuclease